MGLKAGWLGLFLFVWLIGAFLGSTFEYHTGEGVAYTTGLATFTNDSYFVTGNGTTWDNTTMAGGLIMANTDAIWTKIEEVTSTTNLTLYSPYTGTGGTNLAYTMTASAGWAGSGTGGYSQSPTTTLEYLLDVTNSFQRTSMLGVIPIPAPNMEYFKSAFRVVTWRWSFMEDYEMVYWIFCAPFVVMGVLSMLLLVYGVLTGNLTLT